MKKLISFIFLTICVLMLSGCFLLPSESKTYHSVTFEVDGDSTSLRVEDGKKVEKIEDPTKEGYEFIGWYLDDSLYDFSKAVKKDITLVAKFEEKEKDIYYTVTFKDYNGKVLKEERVLAGASATPPENPTREGYEFVSWDRTFESVTSNIVVNALYQKNASTFVVYFFSMKLNRQFGYQPGTTPGQPADRQTACSNTMMDVTMPLMSTFFTFVVPAIIGVYWIFRSVLGTLKQFIMSKIMPLPQFTEEDYKAAARELAGKKPKIEKSQNAGKVRSLHHIDDEDYDDTRDAALARKAAMEEAERKKQEAAAAKAPVEGAAMKEDNPGRKSKKKKGEDFFVQTQDPENNSDANKNE